MPTLVADDAARRNAAVAARSIALSQNDDRAGTVEVISRNRLRIFSGLGDGPARAFPMAGQLRLFEHA